MLRCLFSSKLSLHFLVLTLFNTYIYYFYRYPLHVREIQQTIVDKNLLLPSGKIRSVCSDAGLYSEIQLDNLLRNQSNLTQRAIQRDPSIPVIIFEQSTSGWGNNILGLVSTIILAAMTKRALFVNFHSVKLNQIIHDKWGIFPDVSVLIDNYNVTLEHLRKAYPYTICANEHDQVWLPLTMQMETTYLQILSMSRNSSPHRFIWLQSNQFFAPLLYLRRDYHTRLCTILGSRPFQVLSSKVLSMAYDIETAAQNFAKSRRFSEKLVIGVHIRMKNNAPRWKHLNHPRRLVSTLQCAGNVALLQSSFSRKTVLLISTDSLQLKQIVQNATEFDVIFSEPEFVEPDFSKLPQDIQIAKQAFFDILLLTKADYMVASFGSTFGYLAHGVKGQPPFTVDINGRCFRAVSAEPEMHHFYRIDSLRASQFRYSQIFLEWMHYSKQTRVAI
eukprot:jgi/Galph1/3149/GphlegSOOS_G1817.1